MRRSLAIFLSLILVLTSMSPAFAESCLHETHGQDGLCASCGAAVEHTFGDEHICTVCGVPCAHEEEGGETVEAETAVEDVEGLDSEESGEQVEASEETENIGFDEEEVIASGEAAEEGEPAAQDEAQCTHANREEWEYIEGTYAANGDRQHVITGSLYKHSRCIDCGEGLEPVLLDDNYSREEDHSYYEWNPETGFDSFTGVCKDCGHEISCSHANAHVFDYWEEVEYSPKDDRTHYVVGLKSVIRHCPDCEWVLEWYEITENAETEWDHNYYQWDESQQIDVFTGKCSDCGHVISCTHENADSWEHWEGTYTSNGDQDHIFVGKKYIHSHCNDCGFGLTPVLVDENFVTTQGHHFYEWDNENGMDVYTGVCNACGYVNSCAHENQHEWDDVRGEWYPAGNRQHELTGDVYHILECDDCGRKIETATGETRTIQSDHNFYAHDEEGNEYYTGVCPDCGYENQCGHEDAHFYEEIRGEIRSVSNAEHERSGEVYECMDCDACGVHEEEATGRYETVTEHHNYWRYDHETGESWYEGYCEDCDYWNECNHDGADYWSYIDGEFESIDDRRHSRTGEVIDAIHCEACGEHIENRTGRYETWEEDHQYGRHDDEAGVHEYVGVCEACGHTNECTHENYGVNDRRLVKESFENISGSKHLHYGDHYIVKFCDDCGAEFEWTFVAEDAVFEEDHHFYEWKDEWGCYVYTGYCGACDYNNPCEHSGDVGFDDRCLEDTRYIGINDDIHVVVAKRFETQWCPDCEFEIRRELADDRFMDVEDHHYYEYNEELGIHVFTGVCLVCGHEHNCRHENDVHINENCMLHAEYSAIDAANHRVTGDRYMCFTCNECGHDFAHKLVQTDDTIVEGHHYYEWREEEGRDVYTGYCGACDYHNPCEHENAETHEWINTDCEGGECVSVGDMMHKATGEVWQGVDCPDCGVYFEQKTDRFETREEHHDYYYHDEEYDCAAYDGWCKNCGYENQCDHEGADFWQEIHGATGYEALNEHEHRVRGPLVDRFYCGKCDVDAFMPQHRDEEITEGHHFFVWDEEKNFDVYTGKCEACGYENTCPHENAEKRGFWCSKGEITEILEDGHTWTGYIFDWYYCPDCDTEYNVFMGENESRTTYHIYWDWDDEEQTDTMLDECAECGYERTCEHENAERWAEYRTEDGAEWTSVNDEVCSSYGERIDWIECPDCHNTFCIRSGEYETFEERHNYYYHDEEHGFDPYDGTCDRCGHENQCEHEGADYWTEAWNANYEQVNEYEHRAYGMIIERIRCEQCGIDTEIFGAEFGVIVEGHHSWAWDEELEYDEYLPECPACGYVNECEHENAESWEEIHGDQFVDNGESGHTQTGRLFNRIECPDCEVSYLEYVGENESREFQHEYYWYDGDKDTDTMLDECYWCGHERTCDHSDLEHWTEYDVPEDAVWTANGKTCSAVGERIDIYYCEGCDTEYRVRSGEYETVEEYHDYYDHDEEFDLPVYNGGLCKRCGYENQCEHKNMHTWQEVHNVESCKAINEYEHVTVGLVVNRAWCEECESDWWDVAEEHGELVERHGFHVWDEKQGIDVYTGECEACGYKNACEHTHVYDVVGVYDGTFKTIDHLTHEATGIIVDKKWCGDCDCDIEITVAEVGGTRVLEHWYVDDSNECFDCGFVCEHTELRYSHYIPDELVYFKQQDAETHLVCGPMYRLPICKSCNLWFMDDMTLVDNDGSWPAQHHMEDGVCAECGYVDQSVCTGWVQENGKWCCLDANGSKFKNIWLSDGKGWLYLGEDGYAVASKWVEDNQGWCYVDEYGYMAKTVWAQKDGKWCYLDTYGHMMTDAWVQTAGEWYYVGSDGARVVSSWAADSKGTVYLGADGTITTNSWMENSIGWVYLGADGYMETNCWKTDSAGWCYLGADGLMKKNAWVQTDGKWYCLDENGYRMSGCWLKDQRGWIYLGADGAMMTNAWMQDSVGWCYLGADGYAVTNCWKQDSIGWCYLNGEGSMTKNAWVVTDGQTYWLNGEGYRAENTWVLVDGKWYWLNGDGTMATNMWQKDSIGWVYVGSDGAMVTDAWTQDSVGWCYMGSDGYAVTNTWKHDGTGWRYLDGNGSMMKNAWLLDGGNWYWFNADGYRVTGTVIIDGVENRFDENGVWLS